MAIRPGPPSFSYLIRGDVPVAWQKSSCIRRKSCIPFEATRRSKRSTTNTRCWPNVAISACAVGRPNALKIRRHNHSLSTEVVKSAWRPPMRPRGSLKMWVVGVAPRGFIHWSFHRRKASFSWAPAKEIRKSSSGSIELPKRPGATVSSRWRSMAASSSTTPSTRSTPAGTSPSGSNCSAPTQSRPMAASRSKAFSEPVLKRAATRRRIASLSGNRPSK